MIYIYNMYTHSKTDTQVYYVQYRYCTDTQAHIYSIVKSSRFAFGAWTTGSLQVTRPASIASSVPPLPTSSRNSVTGQTFGLGGCWLFRRPGSWTTENQGSSNEAIVYSNNIHKHSMINSRKQKGDVISPMQLGCQYIYFTSPTETYCQPNYSDGAFIFGFLWCFMYYFL
jgi:hypothetical protein